MIENRKAQYAVHIQPYLPQQGRSMVPASAEHQILGVSAGPSETGYDVRLRDDVTLVQGHAILASTVEAVAMPRGMAAALGGKSTWARLGVSLNTTMIDGGFNGHITIEITYNPLWRGWWSYIKSVFWPRTLTIPAGTGIGTLIFMRTHGSAAYDGKYQHQADGPQGAL